MADRAITLVELRRTIEDEIEDHERFTYERMWPDLQDAGLLRGRHRYSSAGTAGRRRTRDLLFTVQQDFGRPLGGRFDGGGAGGSW